MNKALRELAGKNVTVRSAVTLRMGCCIVVGAGALLAGFSAPLFAAPPVPTRSAQAKTLVTSRAAKTFVTVRFYLLSSIVEGFVTPEDIQRLLPVVVTKRSTAEEIERLLARHPGVTVAPAVFERIMARVLAAWPDGRRALVDNTGVVLPDQGGTYLLTPSAVKQLDALLWKLQEQQRIADAANLERRRPALVKAVEAKDGELVRRLLRAGADPNVCDVPEQAGMTPLMYAAYQNEAAICKLLLQRGAKINAQESNGYNALTYAAMNQSVKTFGFLLTCGASVKGAAGQRVLLYAANGGQYQMVERLLTLGVEVNCVLAQHLSDETSTPLAEAVIGGHVSVVKLLLDKGARVDISDKYGRSALTWAAMGGDDAMARLLLAHGAQVNGAEGNALLLAIRNERVSTVRLLLEHGAKVTPAFWEEARKAGNRTILEMLVQTP